MAHSASSFFATRSSEELRAVTENEIASNCGRKLQDRAGEYEGVTNEALLPYGNSASGTRSPSHRCTPFYLHRADPARPLYSRKRTFIAAVGESALGQKLP